MNRVGIILAGGSGSRLSPITKVLSKQLLPVFDKPMIYYPLSTLMTAGIKNILIITTPDDNHLFEKLLGSGNHLGINISYKIQIKPNGLAEAFLIAEDFIKESSSALILGDNLFYGSNFDLKLAESSKLYSRNTLFAYRVKDPERYGVIEFDGFNHKVSSIIEKPLKPKSNYAATGLYLYDNRVVEFAKKLKPSKRGELEITDLNNIYLEENSLFVEKLVSGDAWLDTGTFDSLLEASMFVSTIEKRQGLKISCPEEIAYKNNWINNRQLKELIKIYGNNDYSNYLKTIIYED